jgi:elongation factor P
VERKDYQYLYKDESGYSFMDSETFEQITVSETLIDAPQFLVDGQQVSVLMNTETELPMSVELPDKIISKVTYSEPGLRGDTATRTLKQATVETGATVMVPLFVNEGDVIRINTKTGEYVERVKD